jgi:serine/threonine protein kinase
MSAADLAAVAAHLENCADCSSSLDALSLDTDPLVAGLRRPVPAGVTGDPEDSRAADLVEALGSQLTTSPATDPTSPSVTGDETADHPPPALEQLGQYELLDKLGEGGMGQVFKARHRLMGRVVALKVVHAKCLDRPDALERFGREIRALAQLDHPNIVRAEYADEVDGTHFLVMEYVPGRDLAGLVRERGPMPVGQACDYVRQAALALQHAHERGLVHRDIKPSNVLVTLDGQVKLLDLGLALLREEQPAGEGLTATGQLMGTYDYMAPEQWDNTHAVDIRADLYSLGCTLYFLLAGRPPFGAPEYASATRKMKAHATEPVPPIQRQRPDVPDALPAVLRRLLAKSPADRYATPAEVAAALQPFTSLSGPAAATTSPPAVPVAPPTASQPVALSSPRRLRRFRRVGVPLGVVGLLLLAAGLVWWSPKSQLGVQRPVDSSLHPADSSLHVLVGERPVYISTTYAYRFSFPGPAWQPDKSLEQDLHSNIALRRTDPNVWLAIFATEYKTRTPQDAELIDEAVRRLRGYFKDNLEWEQQPDTQLAGQRASKLEFVGPIDGIEMTGECLMLASDGVGYWFVTWAPTDVHEAAVREWKAARDGFALVQKPEGSKLRIVSLKVSHFRGDPPVILGDLGDKSQGVREEDDLKVQSAWSEPAYCYLIAFNPNGTEQLCHPRTDAAPPERGTSLIYPWGPNEYFPCTDGVGLQAFVLVASRQPLPAYREWKQRAGAAPWKRLVPPERAWGVWQYDGERIALVTPPERGPERVRGLVLPAVALVGQDRQAGLAGVPWGACGLVSLDGPVQRLEEVCRFFKSRPGVNAVEAVAFPVRPKE